MVHSTGVAQPDAMVFLKNWNKPGVGACVHAFITEDKIYKCLPWNWRGWHAGGSANNTHISFEICEPAGHTYKGGTMIGYDPEKNADYFAKVYKNAVELTAMLCKFFNLDPLEDGVVICHAEGYKRGIASNHADVLHWFPRHGKTMDDFRADVVALMDNEKSKEDDEVIRYQRVTDIPESWNFRAIIDNLMTAGIIGGDGSDPEGNNDIIDLSHDMVRMLIFEYRAGVYDAALEAAGLDPNKYK